MTGFVFGYGSLVPASMVAGLDASGTELPGFRRVWNVAMDNRVDLPGYKYYLAPDGSRPAVFVVYLDIVADPDGSVNGACLPVAAEDLPLLDRRERNYTRVEVTDRIEAPLGPTWTYVGSPEGRIRFQEGAATSSAVVSREYRDLVIAGFEALGPGERRRFEATTEPHDLPVLDLERIELPDP